MALAERVHVSEGLQSDLRVWRLGPFPKKAKTMRLARIGQHFQVLNKGAQFGNQYFLVEVINRLYIALNNQNGALYSRKLGACQLLKLSGVIALWIRRDVGSIRGRITLAMFGDAGVIDARQQMAGRLFGYDGGLKILPRSGSGTPGPLSQTIMRTPNGSRCQSRDYRAASAYSRTVSCPRVYDLEICETERGTTSGC